MASPGMNHPRLTSLAPASSAFPQISHGGITADPSATLQKTLHHFSDDFMFNSYSALSHMRQFPGCGKGKAPYGQLEM